MLFRSEEGIVISGQPGGHTNKKHFLENGLDRAQKALGKRQSDKEGVTWMIYNDGSEKNGYDSKTLDEYKQKAEALGINVKEVSNVSEISNYVNNKDGGNSRANDKITSFYYLGHAKPSMLNPGYPNSNGALDPAKFDASAFASGAWINVVGGCRTDVKTSWFGNNSVTNKFSKLVDKKSTVHGSNVKVHYDGGVMSDSQLLKPNKGEIKTYKGKLK